MEPTRAPDARERQVFLAEASKTLGRTLDLQDTLAAVARVIVPHAADALVVRVETEDEPWELTADCDGRQAKVRPVPCARHRAPDPAAGWLELPLSARGHGVGTAALRPPEGGWEEVDVLFAEELIDRCALAVDNALLHRRTLRAERLHREALVEVAALAYRDALTGLANRRALQEALERAVAHALRERTGVALLYLDLDGFKAVNDRLGHLIGDQLLEHVARRLTHHVRGDDIVARQGGDEFLVMLEDLPWDGGPAIARRAAEVVVRSFEQPFVVAGHHIEVGASVGLSVLPEDAMDAVGLMRRADAAMYAAKREGGQRVSEREAPARHLRLAGPLRRNERRRSRGG